MEVICDHRLGLLFLFGVFFSARNPHFGDLRKRFHPALKPTSDGITSDQSVDIGCTVYFFPPKLWLLDFLSFYSPQSCQDNFLSFWGLEPLAVELWITALSGYSSFFPVEDIFIVMATRCSLPPFFFFFPPSHLFLASLFLAHTFALLYCVWNM